ncbi:MAG: hypothetical protein OQK62_00880, partial [Flavobacteriales bacterium]|nr:hypothetical protein [Flavobacteriales bacterium]
MEKEAIYHTEVEHLQYETELKGKHYKLDVYPQNYFYQLTLPSGKVIEGSIPALISTLEYNHQNPELTVWLLDCLDWKEIKKDNKANRLTKKFTVDGRHYSITFNTKTGMVNLHFPRTIIVGERKNIASPENHPEIYNIRKGMLSDLLTTTIIDSGIIPDDNKELPEQLPQYTNAINYYDLQGWQVGISYNPETEIIILELDSRTEYTHLFTIPLDVPEFNTLH